MSEVRVVREDILGPVAQELIRATNAELMALYPEPGANHFRLDADEVREGRGTFLVAWRESRPVGCGALRTLEAGVGEIKRMYVRPEERGRGVGRAVLEALEAEARGLGMRRVVLETGIRQVEALGLYARAGYEKVEPYGEYTASATTSVCMAKEL